MIIAGTFDWFSQLISNYLIALILLLPLIVCYAWGVINRRHTNGVHKLHKLILIGLTVLPIVLTVFSNVSIRGPSATIDKSNLAINAGDTVTPSVITLENTVINQKGDYSLDTFTNGSNFIFAMGTLVILFLTISMAVSVLLLLVKSIGNAIYLQTIRQHAQHIEIRNNITTIFSSRIEAPFSTHFVNCCIYLPADLPPGYLDLIRRHETNHFYCHHHRWLLLELLLAHVFWFNPLSHIMRHYGDTLRELECDDLTCESVDKLQYGRALVAIAEKLHSNRSALLGQAWVRKTTLRVRINNLLGNSESVSFPGLKLWCLLGFSAALSGCLAGDAVEQLKLEQLVADKIKMTTTMQQTQGDFLNYTDIPPYFIDMLVLSEDKRFFSHTGVDKFAMARAVYKFIDRGVSSGGGSTLTMQMATNVVIGLDAKLRRDAPYKYKSLQMRIAKAIEKLYTKEEILTVYLGGIYWGHQNYGLKQAAEYYYKKDYADLSSLEAAVLIQMIPAPSILNPIDKPLKAEEHAQNLLDRYQVVFLLKH